MPWGIRPIVPVTCAVHRFGDWFVGSLEGGATGEDPVNPFADPRLQPPRTPPLRTRRFREFKDPWIQGLGIRD